jgi:(E)-4-hydroxy-3-methylbut-2-enyl-diphosphate synthase
LVRIGQTGLISSSWNGLRAGSIGNGVCVMEKKNRRSTRRVRVGPLFIGGGGPVLVQSMTNTDTRDHGATLQQIHALAAAGCELVRVAVPDAEALPALERIVDGSPVPVIADIQFNYRLALGALEAGVAKLRINPGNIGGPQRVREVARAAAAHGAAIRVGVNAGSLPRKLLAEKNGDIIETMLAALEEQLRLLLDEGFAGIVVSLKSSVVTETIAACRAFAARWDFPQHLGVTEAGAGCRGLVKSAVGLGVLLEEGIGDTIRVSLTGDPVQEVTAAYEILKALALRERGPVIVSCPTCARCGINLEGLVAAVEEATAGIAAPLHLAVMGCMVNGPGEASRADLGLAGGKNEGVIFRRGKIIRRVRKEDLLPAFLEELERLSAGKDNGFPS